MKNPNPAFEQAVSEGMRYVRDVLKLTPSGFGRPKDRNDIQTSMRQVFKSKKGKEVEIVISLKPLKLAAKIHVTRVNPACHIYVVKADEKLVAKLSARVAHASVPTAAVSNEPVVGRWPEELNSAAALPFVKWLDAMNLAVKKAMRSPMGLRVNAQKMARAFATTVIHHGNGEHFIQPFIEELDDVARKYPNMPEAKKCRRIASAIMTEHAKKA